jgi:hypothetical protein
MGSRMAVHKCFGTKIAIFIMDSFKNSKEVTRMACKTFLSCLSILLALLWPLLTAPSVQGKDGQLSSEVLSHAGESYKGVEDPAYISYDRALRAYMVERINKEFGVALNPKIYSGFDLLEIEALLKCKKANESVEGFLKGFPKHP